MAETVNETRDEGPAGPDPRDRATEALMRLLEGRRWGDVQLADIAGEAGMSLAELRGLYGSRVAILNDFWRRIDQEVLAGGPAEGESARDRLFDLMMRRFDALQPYRTAVRRLAEMARFDPPLAAFLARNALRSQRWTFAGAGLRPSGPEGAIALRGATFVFAEAMRVWLKDDDVDAAATMAALDGALRRGDRVMGFVNRLGCLIRPISSVRTRRRRDTDAEAA